MWGRGLCNTGQKRNKKKEKHIFTYMPANEAIAAVGLARLKGQGMVEGWGFEDLVCGVKSLCNVRPTHTLRVQQRQTATLRTIATTRPPRPQYLPPCLCLHALLYLFALSRLCLCVRIVVYLYCLSVSCGSPPLYITPRIPCLMIINPSLSVLFSNSIRLTALPERLTRTSHPHRSRLRSRAITELSRTA